MSLLDSQVLAFAGFAAILTLSPGPDTLLVIRNSMLGGRVHGVLTTFGICSGLFVHAALSALGLSVVLVQSASLYEAVKWAGAGYLAWLGLQSLVRAVRSPRRSPEPEAEPGARGRSSPLVEGLLTNLLNPKVAVFYLAVLPQFVSPGDPVLLKSLLLALLHWGLGVAWLSLVAIVVGPAHTLVSSRGFRRALDSLAGAILVGFGLRLALERR